MPDPDQDRGPDAGRVRLAGDQKIARQKAEHPGLENQILIGITFLGATRADQAPPGMTLMNLGRNLSGQGRCP